MSRVVVSPHNVVTFPDGGGHAWVYLQYVLALRDLGCDVWWLEELPGTPRADESALVDTLRDRLRAHGLDGRLLLYRLDGGGPRWQEPAGDRAAAVVASADLLLNFHQRIAPSLLALARRTALVDIDPGLLQFWIAQGQLEVAPHDVYLTTGETVGEVGSPIPDVGIAWRHIRPCVHLPSWPMSPRRGRAFTTVSSWWANEWLADAEGVMDNTKRAAYLPYRDLPRRVAVPLELALRTGPEDASELADLRGRGWAIVDAAAVAATPDTYRSYVRESDGEFGCVKPSCRRFKNAWVSDRTLCYMASGRPAVVEDTGPSALFDGRTGLVRFGSLEEAVDALGDVAAAWTRHSRAARELVEAHFDAGMVAARILELCA